MQINKFNLIICIILAIIMTVVWRYVSEMIAVFFFSFFIITTNFKVNNKR